MNKKILFRKNFYASKKQDYGIMISRSKKLLPYLANLSYYLSVFQIDGYHFKRIDSFCKSENGQVIVKCLNLMNLRLH